MPPKHKRPTRRAPTPQSENDEYKQTIDDIVNTLKKCHDVKIRPLGTLIQKIFNTTDKSHKISKTVPNAIQNLKSITVTNKELSKSDLEETNKLIERLQQTVGEEETPDGLINSYEQVVEAIVEYAKNIKCPILKQNQNQLYLENIGTLIALDDALKVCKESGCDKIVKKNKRYNNLYIKLIKIKEHNLQTPISNINRLITFLTEYHRDHKLKYKYYTWHQFRYAGGGLLPYLKYKRNQLELKKGGSKHHKTTKKRIKGKQTRRNKVKNKTTIKAKNKTTIKAKNKTKKR
jgi:hypothetical protein